MRHSQLEFDFDTAAPAVSDVAPKRSSRQIRGRVNYLAGLAAEDAVERHCTALGWTCLDRRWRGPGGEIDLIFRRDAQIIFVEVKAGRTHDGAAARIFQRQADRIALSSLAYLDRHAAGAATDMRIDVALVDGQGRVALLENAFAGWW
ncbi:YraN family protein [Pseudooceanicola onchidii]|uniref:YraN family protein n=1 Tax=Pseudooceanicola onchidii TaxID=2562279 RepID=UPI0010AADC15|nr:YraN family protein [Pseudooceanicola onchidii]